MTYNIKQLKEENEHITIEKLDELLEDKVPMTRTSYYTAYPNLKPRRSLIQKLKTIWKK